MRWLRDMQQAVMTALRMPRKLRKALVLEPEKTPVRDRQAERQEQLKALQAAIQVVKPPQPRTVVARPCRQLARARLRLLYGREVNKVFNGESRRARRRIARNLARRLWQETNPKQRVRLSLALHKVEVS